MIHSVPNDIKNRATKCKHNYSCLETGQCGDRPLCSVEQRDGENVLILETNKSKSCPYRLDFGGRQLCTCPVHFYIES